MSKAKGKKQPKQKKSEEDGDIDPSKFNIYREIRFNDKYDEYPIK